MKTGFEEQNKPITAIATGRPLVVERYSGYSPPFDATRLTEKLIASVPPKFLLGLNEVVLTNTGNLPRKRRRSVTWARKRKVRIVEARALYHPAHRGKAAWIEIYMNNLLKGYESGRWRWLLAFGYFRENEVGGTLFHEIGHHIDATIRPEFREREDVADDWSDRLRRDWFRTQRPYLRRFLRLLMPVIRFLAGILAGKLLREGGMSKREYEKFMKRSTSSK